MQMAFLRPWAPHILSIMRILTAATFLTHGTMKLFGWPAPFEFPMTGLSYAAAILEVVGGLLLIIGLFSRPVAFVLSGEMAVAYFMGHAPQGFFPALNGGRPRCFSASSSSISPRRARDRGASTQQPERNSRGQ
jgi:putative oxidoreductase